jgi:predicted CXXCH cytochrome family protein
MPAWPVSKAWLWPLLGLATVVVLLALAVGWSGVGFRTGAPTERDESPPQPADALPAGFSTPFRNTRPDVAYVSDATCAQCHPDQAETYARHPMGRSLAPVARVAGLQRYDAAVRNPFEAAGATFAVERQGDRVFHKEVHRDARGQPFAEARTEVHYVIGSGVHNYSYLIERDGFLVESPITYYAQKAIWDVSPGFRSHRHNVFERPVVAECLFCHTDLVKPVPDTLNGYRQPIFHEGFAIGCQRCHGPGALHVAERERGAIVVGVDDTIVNPARLPWELREGVCQQCHLEGVKRVLKQGRQFADYRPGLPWQMFWTVFVRDAGHGDERFDSSVEQLYASRCFQASQGRMGCTTCHDAHRLPEAADKTRYYRERCLQCHDEQSGCSLPLAVRHKESPQDDCRACHMPSFPSRDIPHTAATDHRIPRKPAPTPGAAPTQPAEVPLRPFQPDVAGYRDGESARARALVLTELADGRDGEMRARTVLPLLDNVLRDAPDDWAAWEARAESLAALGRSAEALAVCGEILAKAPRRETTLHLAATLAQALKRPEEAVHFWQRLREVNPSSLFYRVGLAQALAALGDWERAVPECEAILERYPPNLEARLLLLEYHVGRGDREQARGVFEQVLALKPPDEPRLRRWFGERMK